MRSREGMGVLLPVAGAVLLRRCKCSPVRRDAQVGGRCAAQVDRSVPPVRPWGTIRDVQPVELAVGDLLLRPWRVEDTELVLAAMQDPDIRLWNGFSGEFGVEDVGVWLTRRMNWASGTHASWAVQTA